MITAKIFKIKETIENGGRKFFRVLGYNSRFEYFMGMYSFEGSKENDTFMEALEQIDTLVDCAVISDKTIHVVFSKKSETKSKIKDNISK